MSDPEIEFSIKSDVSLVAFVGRAISALLAGTGMPKQRVATFELAVVEVVTNVIEHAYEFDKEKTVELGFRLTAKTAVVEVRDHGQPLPEDVVERYTNSNLKVKEPGENISDLPVSGWGISLVAQLCDEVTYRQETDSNVLTLICEIDSSADSNIKNTG